MQEVKQLEDQKKEAKDKESKKAIELKLKLKELEKSVASSKWVSQRHNFTMDVICYEVGLGALLCGMW